METGSDYYIAWTIYLLAVVAAEILLWRLMVKMKSSDVKQVLHIIVLSILLTPSALDGDSGYWVPAFMIATMDGLNDGVDALMSGIWPILIVMLALLSLSVLRKLLLIVKRGRSTA